LPLYCWRLPQFSLLIEAPVTPSSLPEWKLKRSFGAFVVLVSILLFSNPLSLLLCTSPKDGKKVFMLLAAGSFTGFFSGMLGVGGGVIMIPVMVLLVGLDQHTAQGSSLLTMVPAGIVGAWTHMALRQYRNAPTPGLIPGVLIGTYIGGNLAHFVQDGVLRSIFGIMLVWTGYQYLKTPVAKQVLQK